MSDELGRIEAKLDKVADTLSEQAVTLGRQNVTLEVHVKRTMLLEEAHKELKEIVAPLTRAHLAWIGVGKALAMMGAATAAIAALVGILEGAIHLLGHA